MLLQPVLQPATGCLSLATKGMSMSATLTIQITRDWETAMVQMSGIWSSRAIREVRGAIEGAGFVARSAPTHYLRQLWTGPAADLAPIVADARRERLSSTVEVVAEPLDGQDMTTDEVLAEFGIGLGAA